MFCIHPSGCGARRQHFTGFADLACLQIADEQGLVHGFLVFIPLQAQLCNGGGDGTSGTRERPGGLPLMQDVADLRSEPPFNLGGDVIVF